MTQRLIDKDKLAMYIADIILGESPNGYEDTGTRQKKENICKGLKMAMDAIESAEVVVETRVVVVVK